MPGNNQMPRDQELKEFMRSKKLGNQNKQTRAQEKMVKYRIGLIMNYNRILMIQRRSWSRNDVGKKRTIAKQHVKNIKAF